MIKNDTPIKLKTKAEIIEETAAFYNLNNRSVHNDGCVYFAETTGNSCAVGRCLNADVVGLGSMNKETSAEMLFEELGFNILKDEYKIKDISFWQELQFLHDTEDFWSVNGLTGKGLEYKKQLLQKYDN